MNKIFKVFKILSWSIFLIFVFLVAFLVLIMTTRGEFDKTKQKILFQDITEESITRAGGPYEVSISTGRYALTESIVKNKSLIFTEQIAKFASPDVISTHLGFSSVFTPGVSLLAVPFYILGNHFGFPQIFTYFLNPIVSLINVGLIALLTYIVTKNRFYSLASGFIFLFGTNAFSYAHSLTQHHLSSVLILLALLNTFNKKLFWSNLIYGLIFSLGFLIDFPNIFLQFPLFLFQVSKNFSIEKSVANDLKLRISKYIFILILSTIPFFGLFGLYNLHTTGNPLLLAQFVGITDTFSKNAPSPYKNTLINQEGVETYNPVSSFVNIPFKTRRMLNGFLVLFASDERSWLHYSPVVLIGLVGFISYLFKNKESQLSILTLAIFIVNVVVYTMFGDVWGGWAFGPRYLIPSAALFSIFCLYPLTWMVNKLWKFFIYLTTTLLIFTSVNINTIAILTTSALPPRQEAINLLTPIPHDLELNYSWLYQNRSSSLLFNYTLQEKISAISYSDLITLIAFLLIMMLILLAQFDSSTVNLRDINKSKINLFGWNFQKGSQYIRKVLNHLQSMTKLILLRIK